MVFWVDFRVSIASSRTISRIAVLAILQTIALPTELPRRDPHFSRKFASRSNVCATNGLGNHVDETAMVLRGPSTSRARPLLSVGSPQLRNHCSLRDHVLPRTPSDHGR